MCVCVVTLGHSTQLGIAHFFRIPDSDHTIEDAKQKNESKTKHTHTHTHIHTHTHTHIHIQNTHIHTHVFNIKNEYQVSTHLFKTTYDV